MLDTSRWLLVEVWLSLGLRIEWARSYIAREVKDWQECEETRQHYIYAGGDTWQVLEPADGYRRFPRAERPMLGTSTMRHELAHYLAATAAEREAVDFGIGQNDEPERRATEVEKVIEAMLCGANRIAAMAVRS